MGFVGDEAGLGGFANWAAQWEFAFLLVLFVWRGNGEFLEVGDFGEYIADENIHLSAQGDAVGIVGEPDFSGTEFGVGLEGVGFFGVHPLDF